MSADPSPKTPSATITVALGSRSYDVLIGPGLMARVHDKFPTGALATIRTPAIFGSGSLLMSRNFTSTCIPASSPRIDR